MPQILTPENFQSNPQQQVQMQMGMDIQRIAVGLDMLVGLLAEKWGYEVKEQKDENGNTLLRWRSKDSEATES